MKIIDLIGLLISNETMPKHIIFEDEDYYWVRSANDYICNDHDATRLFNNQYNMSNLPLFLGKTVKILEVKENKEEKKIPEKLDKYADVSGDLAYDWTFGEKKLKDKINEIIDYLKSKGE